MSKKPPASRLIATLPIAWPNDVSLDVAQAGLSLTHPASATSAAASTRFAANPVPRPKWTVHVPLTPDTRGLTGQAELASMKHGSFVVNCAHWDLAHGRRATRDPTGYSRSVGQPEGHCYFWT